MLVVILGTRWSGKTSLLQELSKQGLEIVPAVTTRPVSAWNNEKQYKHVTPHQFYTKARENQFVEFTRFSTYGSSNVTAVEIQTLLYTKDKTCCIALGYNGAKELSAFCIENSIPIRIVHLYANDIDIINNGVDKMMETVKDFGRDTITEAVKTIANKLVTVITVESNGSIELENSKTTDSNIKNLISYNTSFVAIQDIARDIMRHISGDQNAT